MSGPRFRPIIPRRDPFARIPKGLAAAARELVLFARAAQGDLQDYPPQVAGVTYRRTGDLGRDWSVTEPLRLATSLLVRVTNKIPYAIHVEGPKRGPKGKRQVKWAARYGWPSVTTVARERWRQFRPRIRRALRTGR